MRRNKKSFLDDKATERFSAYEKSMDFLNEVPADYGVLTVWLDFRESLEKRVRAALRVVTIDEFNGDMFDAEILAAAQEAKDHVTKQYSNHQYALQRRSEKLTGRLTASTDQYRQLGEELRQVEAEIIRIKNISSKEGA